MVNEERLKELSSLFECSRCGACCTNDLLGIVTSEEADKLSEYVRGDDTLHGKVNFLPLVSSPGSYTINAGKPCPFYDTFMEQCIVYEIRPQICRNYPIKSLCACRGSVESSLACLGFVAALSKYFDVDMFSPEVM